MAANGYTVALGSVLTELREQRQLSRWAVEEDSLRLIRHGDLAAWERGERDMHVSTLARLCAFYDVPTSVVLDRADTRYRIWHKPAVAAWRIRSQTPQPSTEAPLTTTPLPPDQQAKKAS